MEIRKEIIRAGVEDKIAYSVFSDRQVLVPTLSLEESAKRKLAAMRSRTEMRDYFDMEFMINKFLEGTSSSAFKNLTTSQSAKQIKEIHASLNEPINVYYDNITVNVNQNLGNSARCTQIIYVFNSPLTENKPIYRTEQRYNAYNGGYYNEQVFDRYETVYNENLTVNRILYTIQLYNKAQGKEQDIINSLTETIKTKTGGAFQVSVAPTVSGSSTNIVVTVQPNSNTSQ